MGSSIVSSPLLTRTTRQEIHGEDEEEAEEQGAYKSASMVSAVFTLSTSIVGAGIMSLPATIRIVGVVPGSLLIIFVAFFTNMSVDFLLRYSRAAKADTYGGVVGDAFGRYGGIILQLFLVFNGLGGLVVYLIIMADVLSGSTSASVHHSGVLEQWAGGSTWWNGRRAVMVFVTVLVLCPLVSFRHIDSLRVPSALSVALAILFVVAISVIAMYKIMNGDIGLPRLFPDFKGGTATVIDCVTAIPVVVTSYICHHCLHPVVNELEKGSNPKTVVRTSLALCTTIYLATSLSAYLLFGEDTLPDVLSNFDVDLGVPYSNVIANTVRISYAIHLILVFPVLQYALRFNLDDLIFPDVAARPHDTQRFILLTVCTMAFSLFGACYIPSIWDVFQIAGSTTLIVMSFIFPPSIVLRDAHGISTRAERWGAWFMIVAAVASSSITLAANFL